MDHVGFKSEPTTGSPLGKDVNPSNGKTQVTTNAPTKQSKAGLISSTTTEIDSRIHRETFRVHEEHNTSHCEVTDDPEAIRKQVEFYFGDWNYPQDKFMWESCEGTANKPLPISLIHTFKRMRHFQPYRAVVSALRDSKLLEVVGKQGEELIKRKSAYSPVAEGRGQFEAATVYVKGFGAEDPDTQSDLEIFFSQYDEIKGLKLRRTNDGHFKGSVFVTFSDEGAARKFIDLKPAPRYRGHELNVMLKRVYCEGKSELIRQGRLQPNSHPQKKFFEGKDLNKRVKPGRNLRKGQNTGSLGVTTQYAQEDGLRNRRGGSRARSARGRGSRNRGSDSHSKNTDYRRDQFDRPEDMDESCPSKQPSSICNPDKEDSANTKRLCDGHEILVGAPMLKKIAI